MEVSIGTGGRGNSRGHFTPLRLLSLAAGACLVAASGSVSAQNGSSFLQAQTAAVDYTKVPIHAASACEDLVSLTSFEFSVLTAMHVAAAEPVPEHCRVSGVIPPEIVFEVDLPLAWNGRLYMHGNGGYAGEPPDASNRSGPRDEALQRGFATVYTNTGHDRDREPLATFAYNDVEKTLDYAFRAVHLTVSAAKSLVTEFYGRAANRSYWDGCSTGGREGLMSAQRFPADFDGIVAGAPVLDLTGQTIANVWNSLALREAPLSAAKVATLAERVYAQCDAIDGLKDGLIDDPRRCGFDPVKDLPMCEAGDDADACFTPAEIETVRKIYAGPSADGHRLYPGQAPGAEVAVPSPQGSRSGWRNWLLNPDGAITQLVYGETFLKYLAYPEDDPSLDWTHFDFAGDPARMAGSAVILNATNPDLSRFKARGGKMITYAGWADAAVNPARAIEYYEQVEETTGRADDFYRLFLVPGMFHCRGGVGADQFDAFTPLIDWVEAGKAPGRIVGVHVEGQSTKFTRPHCPYPQVARYKGSGAITDAESFACGRIRP
jgi:Tannase and feruloyl esterase